MYKTHTARTHSGFYTVCGVQAEWDMVALMATPHNRGVADQKL